MVETPRSARCRRRSVAAAVVGRSSVDKIPAREDVLAVSKLPGTGQSRRNAGIVACHQVTTEVAAVLGGCGAGCRQAQLDDAGVLTKITDKLLNKFVGRTLSLRLETLREEFPSSTRRSTAPKTAVGQIWICSTGIPTPSAASNCRSRSRSISRADSIRSRLGRSPANLVEGVVAREVGGQLESGAVPVEVCCGSAPQLLSRMADATFAVCGRAFSVTEGETPPSMAGIASTASLGRLWDSGDRALVRLYVCREAMPRHLPAAWSGDAVAVHGHDGTGHRLASDGPPGETTVTRDDSPPKFVATGGGLVTSGIAFSATGPR